MRDQHPATRLTPRAPQRLDRQRQAAHRRRATGLAGALLLALAAARAPADDAQVVAQVNGTPITQGMVSQVVKSLVRERAAPPSSEEIANLNDSALDSLIDLELLYQAAQKAGVRVTDEEVAAEIAKSKAQFGGDKAFAAALQRSGMTEAELAADTRKTLMVDRFIDEHVAADVHVTPDAARQFYDTHRPELEHDGLGSFDAARPAIEKTLLESARRERQQAYVDALRTSAHIERPTPARQATAASAP